MSLSDRLAEAAKQRQGGTTALRTAPARTAAPSSSTAVQVILGPSKPAVAVDPDPAVPADAVCPTCGRTGEPGTVDLARRTTDWSCDACGSMWRSHMPPSADGELLPPVR